MKRWIPIAASALILAVLYWKIDFGKMQNVLRGSDWTWIGASFALVVPITLLMAWRLYVVVPSGVHLPFGEANRLTLAAYSLNVVLPSKGGEIAKAYFIGRTRALDGGLALSVVLLEKICDVVSLLLWCSLGLVVYAERGPFVNALTACVMLGLAVGFLVLSSASFSGALLRILRTLFPNRMKHRLEQAAHGWTTLQGRLRGERGFLPMLLGISLLIWFLNLLQIWLFIRALGSWMPFLPSLALGALAIFVGLLPITLAGIGTRDLAFVAFYAPFLSAAAAAAVGLLYTLRYLLPALAGLLFLGRYISILQVSRKRTGSPADSG